MMLFFVGNIHNIPVCTGGLRPLRQPQNLGGFTYDERLVGYIKGYKRVFYQGSIDHRGTPARPGRVVTLEAEDGAICWGAAYRVSGCDAEHIALSYLDVREKQYDQKIYVDFFTDSSPIKPAVTNLLLYLASADKSKNVNYLGPAPLKDMASQIAKCRGPSGPNYEYLFQLEQALCEIGCVDEDLSKLAAEVKKLLNLKNGYINPFRK